MVKIKEFFKYKTVIFNGIACKIHHSYYMSRRLYLELLSYEDSSLLARITLDLDTVPIIDDMVIIKSYKENEGVYEALIRGGIIKPCERLLEIGNYKAHVCFLNLD